MTTIKPASPSAEGKEADIAGMYSKWWIPHLFVTVWMLPLYAVMAVHLLVEISRTGLFLFLQGWLFVYLIFSLAALLGFYRDAQRLSDSGSDWVPRWYLYVLGSFLLTPSVTSPLYLARRDRHVGINWGYLREVVGDAM